MNSTDLLQKIGETLGSTTTVKSVFGEPIHVDGKTVVPVARVAFGFGGGFGGRKDRAHGDAAGEGGGGGGGVRAYPAGVLEVTEDTTRFVPFVDPQRVLVAATAGAVLGAVFFLTRRRK